MKNSLFYRVESGKSFYEACHDLAPIVERFGFVIVGQHDLGEMLGRREIDIDEDCQVFDICNYRQAEHLLASDMLLSLLVPWRIAVFTEDGATWLALLRPSALLAAPLAELEEKMIQIIDETR